MNISLLINILFNWIENKSKRKYYVYFLTFFLVCMSLLFATPKYEKWIRDFNKPQSFLTPNIPRSELVDNLKYSWEVTKLKADNLLDPLTQIDQTTSPRNRVFRLTPPLIIKIFRLNPLTTNIVQFILGIFFISLFYRFSKKILDNPVAATFLCAGLVFTYFGRVFFFDIGYGFDGLAYLLLLLAMYYRNPVLVFSFATLAAWTDERALIALSIVLIFHQVDFKNSENFKLKNLVKLNAQGLAVIGAIFGYVILRMFLTYRYNMHTASGAITNLTQVLSNILGRHMLAGLWSFLEGFWLLYIFIIGFAISGKHFAFLVTVTFPILVLGLGSFFVDTTRSGSFMVPVVFIFLAYLNQFMNKKEMNILLCICMIFSFIYPAYYIAQGFSPYPPVFMSLFNF